jgi:DNA-binding NarL/FixJ family response regulator
MYSPDTITISIADDHSFFVQGLIHMLASHPQIKVSFTASNGFELIEQFKNADTLPHICLLDINMPVMNGYETLAVLSGEWPSVKTIILSLYGDEIFPIHKTITEGACGCLCKGTSAGEIVDAIYSVYRHGYYTGGAVAKHLPNGPASARRLLTDLSENEMTFLQLCCTAMDYHEIAREMGKSRRTVDNYRDSLFSKLGINSRPGLTLFATRAGLNRFAQ